MDARRWLADGETWRGRYGRQQSLESFAAFGKLGADDGRTGMDLRADMAGDKPDNPFGFGGFQPRAGIDAALPQPVQP